MLERSDMMKVLEGKDIHSLYCGNGFMDVCMSDFYQIVYSVLLYIYCIYVLLFIG